MTSADDTNTQMTQLLDVLRARVEQRRAAGIYPPGLEEQLEDHFRRISAHRIEPNINDVREALEVARDKRNFAMERTELTSSMPGGDRLHRALAKMQARQIVGVLGQVSEFADAVIDVLEALTAAVASPESHIHPDLIGQLDSVLERVANYDRADVDDPAAVADLRRRVEQLEARETERKFQPWFTNDRFEESFRGSDEELRGRYTDLADTFRDLGPVVDIGCGRGEFLELLAERDIEARGVEVDLELVRAARDKGLTVELCDGLDYLRRQDDDSLGGIVLIQVVEHLTTQGLLDLVILSRDKLRPGGRLVCETVNPQSLYVFAHSFYLDPTHVKPIHPAYLSFLMSEAGFAAVETEWRSAPPEEARLEVPEGDPLYARNVDRLNQLLFAPQDYAVIATR